MLHSLVNFFADDFWVEPKDAPDQLIDILSF